MRSPVAWLTRLFTSTEEPDQAEQQKEQEQIRRLAHDPFRFRDRASWLRYRRRHGFSNRGLR